MSGGEKNGPGGNSVGQGFLFITGAKLYFLATATFASLAFPRLFGDQVLFGRFRVISGILNVITMVVITAGVQAVSKLSSEQRASVAAVRRRSLLVHTAVFGPVFLAIFCAADLIAATLLDDPALGAPLRVASLVVAAYTPYAVLVGTLNGTRRFGRQAALDVTFSTLKTGLMAAAVVVLCSVEWAFAGFAAAAFLVLLASIRVARPREDDIESRGTPPAGRVLGYLLPLAAYALVLNVLLQADVVWIKAAYTGGAEPGSEGLADAASVLAGVFGAAKNLAMMPYQAVISLALVVFPLVSRTTSAGGMEEAGRTVAGAMRLAAVLSAAAVAVLGAAPAEVIALLFGPDYVSGAQVLPLLLAAMGLLAISFVGNAVMASAGMPFVSLASGSAAAAVQVGVLAILVTGAGDASHTAMNAATATLAGTASGAVFTVSAVARTFRATGWGRTLAGAVLAAGAGLAVSWAPGDSLPWPARPVVAVAVFAAVITATGAVRVADIGSLGRVFSRG